MAKVYGVVAIDFCSVCGDQCSCLSLVNASAHESDGCLLLHCDAWLFMFRNDKCIKRDRADRKENVSCKNRCVFKIKLINEIIFLSTFYMVRERYSKCKHTQFSSKSQNSLTYIVFRRRGKKIYLQKLC